MTTIKDGVLFGALAPPLHEQLNADEETLVMYQEWADAVTRLYVSNILTQAEASSARRRITDSLERALL